LRASNQRRSHEDIARISRLLVASTLDPLATFTLQLGVLGQETRRDRLDIFKRLDPALKDTDALATYLPAIPASLGSASDRQPLGGRKVTSLQFHLMVCPVSPYGASVSRYA
jgi:hypothetical protein